MDDASTSPAGARRQRVVMAQLIRREDADRSFDLAFWQAVSAEVRMAVAWEMVQDARRIRGERGEQPRLQRSVAVLKRRDG